MRMKALSIVLICGALLLPGSVSAQKKGSAEFDPYSATIEENISTPGVNAKHSTMVAEAMGPLLRTLRKNGYSVDAVRNGEVVVVTIPAEKLFAPNSTELKDDAGAVLGPLKPYMARTDNYKVIIAAHSDDTGDELYAERLTADRANAVDDYYYRASGNTDTGFIPYGIGFDEPVAPNTGIKNRALNRRVEIYFVPTSVFIEKARKNR